MIINFYFQLWCTIETDDYLQQIYDDGRYPPAKYRVIGTVSNMKEFAEAFNCPVDSKMNPSRKCTLW